MGLWDSGLAGLLKDMGETCTATISGSVTTFYGILDQASSIQSDGYGNDVYVVGTHLSVEQSIANQLTKYQAITVNGVIYTIRDFVLSNDPYVAMLDVAKVTP